MNPTPDVAKNRAIVLDVLRDPATEQWHTRNNYFDIIDLEKQPAIGTCSACALGIAALAIGFSDFTLVRHGESDPDTDETNDGMDYWRWSDNAALTYVQLQTATDHDTTMRVIQLNDEEYWTLESIADYLAGVWEREGA